MVASFGGIVLVSVLLGLIIPIMPGGGAIYVLQPLTDTAVIATGPIGGFVLAILLGTPRPFALLNYAFTGWMYPLIAILYYPIRDWNLKKRYPLTILIIAICNWITVPEAAAFYVWVYRLVPVDGYWPLVIFRATTFVPPTIIADAICLPIIMYLWPKYIRPEWWGRWKEQRAKVKEWEEKYGKK
jgi:hypothetical protein